MIDAPRKPVTIKPVPISAIRSSRDLSPWVNAILLLPGEGDADDDYPLQRLRRAGILSHLAEDVTEKIDETASFRDLRRGYLAHKV